MQHDSSETLDWQERGGRAVSQVLNARIHMIEKASSGLFGILKSPSIVTEPGDKVVVTFTLTDASGATPAARNQVKIKLIKSELGDAREGDAVMLDLIDKHTCVGIRAGVKK